MFKENIELYHPPQEPKGYWTNQDYIRGNIGLEDGTILPDVTPIDITIKAGKLVMVLASPEEEMTVPINNFPGLRVVTGDSGTNSNEVDGELLIEIHYLKKGKMEKEPRRIRPTGIMFGIHGSTEEKEGVDGHSHRAMGEGASFHLVGVDTQYDPEEDSHQGSRRFPFWRIGIQGNSVELMRVYLPESPPEE